ncbi:MAG: hypothetical protein HQK72_06075 [Desulfamplus sp.]|nr:hypothetical protein [Desulfamplus sp.]
MKNCDNHSEYKKELSKNIGEIGFSENNNQWKTAAAMFSNDKLQVMGHPVMEDWEKPYMLELARIATLNGGSILELGFGMGISAGYIQQYEIETHIIIEPNHDVFNKLLSFASKSVKKVIPMCGFWQEVIHLLADESLDGILFDTYPTKEDEIEDLYSSFFPHAYRLLKPNGIFTYYSNEVDSFSPQDIERLNSIGFKNIDYTICEVEPPTDCLYWKSNKMLAPIIKR